MFEIIRFVVGLNPAIEVKVLVDKGSMRPSNELVRGGAEIGRASSATAGMLLPAPSTRDRRIDWAIGPPPDQFAVAAAFA